MLAAGYVGEVGITTRKVGGALGFVFFFLLYGLNLHEISCEETLILIIKLYFGLLQYFGHSMECSIISMKKQRM